jgi:4'-phosphopantetheinyl transferase
MSNKWNSIDVLPRLEDDEVQLWRIELSDSPGGLVRHYSLLSTVEQAHASRQRTSQARDLYTIGRACLRILVGNALGIPPVDVTIGIGVHGKPQTPPIDGSNISFNVAHSRNTILIALRRQGAVGVDIEYVDRVTDAMEVARGNFHENETASLEAVADPQSRLKTFYRYWARKEAIVKADGRGLLLPLTSFDVSFDSMDSQPVRVVEAGNAVGKVYFVSDLDLEDKAVAAIALESSATRIRKLTFPLDFHRVAEAGK